MKRLEWLFRSLLPIVCLALLGPAPSASAAVANVSVVNFAFVPATTNIHANDTVLWTWPSGSFNHNVFSDSTPEAWPPSDVLNGPATFQNTFTTSGTFPYECTVHGFTGSIVVSGAAPTPPTVSITAPSANATFAAPANVQIAATATAGSGATIASVQFLVNGASIGTSTTAPYSATAPNLAAGGYTLSVIATDNNGLTATGSVQITVIAAPTVNIVSPAAGAVFTAPASFPIAATAAISGGTIASVQFLVDGNLVGTATTQPYSAAASGLAVGSHSLTAIATDNSGSSATNSIAINVVASPTIAITSPAPGAIFGAPATFAITATPGSGDAISSVQFFVGATSLGTSTTSPFTETASNLTAGTYTLSAVATGISGFTATNSIQVTVSAGPAVTISSPVASEVFPGPVQLTISADATNSSAAITNVAFLVNGTVISNLTTAPFTAQTDILTNGAYNLSVIATDANGLAASNQIQVSVVSSPTAAITSPANGATLTAPATFVITATASNSPAAITNVEFLIDGSLITNTTTAPYTASVSNAAPGEYTLTVIATDANGFTASNSVQVSVSLPVTIWTGPSITFSNAAGSDPTLASSQDRVTTNVWITRGPTMGIFNAAQETNFTAAISPADTEWAFGTLDNYATLSYTNWNTWARLLGQSPTNTVGQAAVVHLISDNIYLSLTFTSWGTSSSEFAYVRSTPPGTVVITPITLASTLLAGGQLQFVINGLTLGKTNYVQSSGDLSSSSNWVTIVTNVASSTNLNVTGLAATNAFQFFRVIQNP